jgi:hypothetical protein
MDAARVHGMAFPLKATLHSAFRPEAWRNHGLETTGEEATEVRAPVLVVLCRSYVRTAGLACVAP